MKTDCWLLFLLLLFFFVIHQLFVDDWPNHAQNRMYHFEFCDRFQNFISFPLLKFGALNFCFVIKYKFFLYNVDRSKVEKNMQKEKKDYI